MLPNQKLVLLRGNLLVEGHVHALGDVVEVDGERAKELLKTGAAAVAKEGAVPTARPVARGRSEVIAENAAAAAQAAAQAHAEKAERRPKA